MDSNKYNKLKYRKVFRDTITDGHGLRMSIYFAGCTHRCNGCHNESSTWDPNIGDVVDDKFVHKVGEELQGNPLLAGITLSGGDPMFNPQGIKAFIAEIKKYLQPHQNIWIYSGYTYEELKEDPMRKDILKEVNYLVDGRFDIDTLDPTLLFRGSRNQRILKLENGQIVNQLDSRE